MKFAGPRLRPALELLGRVPLGAPRQVVDLGCGPGNVTTQLAIRWPDARVVGLDNSAAMIAAARVDFPELEFEIADIDGWVASEQCDVIYSNAALHWVDHHERLFPHLLDQVSGGGYLAVQIPANFADPSHTIVRDLARAPRWAAQLEGVLPQAPVAEPADYHRWLARGAEHLDVWETTYLHRLEGPDPVFEWIKGSWLRPVLSRLDAAEVPAFEAECQAALAGAFPADEAGSVLLPFRRIFVVASPTR